MENSNLPVEVTKIENEAMRTNLEKNFKNYCSSVMNKFINDDKLINKNIKEAENRCQIAKEHVDMANDYEASWWKWGASKKKMRLLAEAQTDMANAMISLQQVQALQFKFQRTLSNFCIVCLQAAMKNSNQLNELCDICIAIEKRQQMEEDMSESAINEIKNLHSKADEQKKYLEEKEQHEKNQGKYIGIAAIIIVLVIVLLLMTR